MMNLHGVILLAAAMAAPAMPQQPMAMDTPVSFGNVQTVCTGVGSAKDDPQWTQYPVRIEFSNDGAQYLSGAHVMLSKGGKPLGDLNCSGPWVLVNGAPGKYDVTATINGSNAKPAHGTFNLRSGPTQRVVLRFPDFQANE